MKKQASKKLRLSTETLRALPSDNELGQVVGGMTTAVTCGCSAVQCTTAVTCGSPTVGCTTAIICG
jgi:hypothetical protein